MEIEKMAVLSTAHLPNPWGIDNQPNALGRLLSKIATAEGENGYLFSTWWFQDEGWENLEKEDQDLLKPLRYTMLEMVKRHEVYYVLFDSAGPVEELPTWDW